MKQNETKQNHLKTYFQGFIMGIFETIPGISGSTIAFSLGIYKKLINSLYHLIPKKISVTPFLDFIKSSLKEKKKKIQTLNIPFLFFLFFGMLTAVGIFSSVMLFLYEHHFTALVSFFVGLILTLTLLTGKPYLLNKSVWSFNVLGGLLGLSLLILKPAQLIGNSPFEIMFLGFFSVFFGLLPGISGSFILLLLGKYEFILTAIKHFDFVTLGLFASGLFLGALIFIHFLKHLIKEHQEKTFSFFFAFVLGSLSVLISQIAYHYSSSIEIVFPLLIGIGSVYLTKKFFK